MLDVTRKNGFGLICDSQLPGPGRSRVFARCKRVKAFFGIERAARLKLDPLEAVIEGMFLAVEVPVIRRPACRCVAAIEGGGISDLMRDLRLAHGGF